MKGMHVEVYRAQWDCTLNGISKDHNTLTLIGEGIPQLFEPNDDAPAIYLVKDKVMGRERIRVTLADYERKWYMFGGNFVYSSDSRFPSDAPIKIFDRHETDSRYSD